MTEHNRQMSSVRLTDRMNANESGKRRNSIIHQSRLHCFAYPDIHNNTTDQIKPVNLLALLACNPALLCAALVSGTLTTKSKTGQECRNVFFGLISSCHSLTYLQTEREVKMLSTLGVAKVMQSRTQDLWTDLEHFRFKT